MEHSISKNDHNYITKNTVGQNPYAWAGFVFLGVFFIDSSDHNAKHHTSIATNA